MSLFTPPQSLGIQGPQKYYSKILNNLQNVILNSTVMHCSHWAITIMYSECEYVMRGYDFQFHFWVWAKWRHLKQNGNIRHRRCFLNVFVSQFQGISSLENRLRLLLLINTSERCVQIITSTSFNFPWFLTAFFISINFIVWYTKKR